MSKSPGSNHEHSPFREVGTLAWRSVLIGVTILILTVAVLGLGFFVYRQRITPEPFLLLVGIVVGFILGRLDAIL